MIYKTPSSSHQVLVPPEVPKQVLVAEVPGHLAAALSAYNASQPAETRIRLRLAFHPGEIQHDEHGVVGSAIKENDTTAWICLPDDPGRSGEAVTSAPSALMTMTWEIAAVEAGTRVDIVAEDVPDGVSAEDHAAALSSSLAAKNRR